MVQKVCIHTTTDFELPVLDSIFDENFSNFSSSWDEIANQHKGVQIKNGYIKWTRNSSATNIVPRRLKIFPIPQLWATDLSIRNGILGMSALHLKWYSSVNQENV